MPNVFDTVKDPAGSLLQGTQVEITLVAGKDIITNGFVTGSTYTISSKFTVSTDAAGKWQANLTPNSLVTPSGTAYRVRYKRQHAIDWEPPMYIIVPNGAGPYWIYNILSEPPVAGSIITDLTSYQLRSEKNAVGGYAGLAGGSGPSAGKVSPLMLGAGSPAVGNFLRGDGVWATPAGGGAGASTYDALDRRSVAGAVHCDASLFNVFWFTLVGGIGIDFINLDTTKASTLVIFFQQDFTGGRGVIFGSQFKWPAGAGPAISSGAGKIDCITAVCAGDATSLMCFTAGQDIH